jgi:hypothetical protein
MQKRKRRWLSVLLGAVAALWLVLCAGFYWAMTRPPEVFGAIVARTPMPALMVLPFETLWKRARAGALHPGEPAPDFQLPTVDHRDTVRLSSFRGSRPVALIFGSYT